MQTIQRLAAPFGLALLLWSGAVDQAAADDPPPTEDRGGSPVVVRDVAVSGDSVTGTIVNGTSLEVRDVQIMVTRAWLWRNEQRPGEVNPGGSYPFVFPGPIAPRAKAEFRFPVPPVETPPQQGRFSVSAAVSGFTEVEYPGR